MGERKEAKKKERNKNASLECITEKLLMNEISFFAAIFCYYSSLEDFLKHRKNFQTL
jgi:hypothetical protein